MSQKQLEVLGWHSANPDNQNTGTFRDEEAKKKKRGYLLEDKKTQGKIRLTGTQLIHNVYYEETKS